MEVDFRKYMMWDPPLVAALQTLDVASNGISHVEVVPDVLILAGNPSVSFAAGALGAAVAGGNFLDLQNVTLQNKTEA